ncbi:hypothetical protein CBR_g23098 [Chara braunii]|uniref:Uncharacterized protein n=1 Tax=Chara braunii TaxID=69332 RepID=A0A388L3V2_CHABU|nr:hypothetical protein CBR_g23098 [Chara braunii]|eukprot:GBG76883.1 hypothetical protein CBR_g23098 [Chara braunii]
MDNTQQDLMLLPVSESLSDFRTVFGKIQQGGDPVRAPAAGLPHPLIFCISAESAEDSVRRRELSVVVTDFRGRTWATSRSLSDLEELREDIGVGGTWIDFLHFLRDSFAGENVQFSAVDDGSNHHLSDIRTPTTTTPTSSRSIPFSSSSSSSTPAGKGVALAAAAAGGGGGGGVAKLVGQKAKMTPKVRFMLRALRGVDLEEATAKMAFALLEDHTACLKASAMAAEEALKAKMELQAERKRSEFLQSEVEDLKIGRRRGSLSQLRKSEMERSALSQSLTRQQQPPSSIRHVAESLAAEDEDDHAHLPISQATIARGRGNVVGVPTQRTVVAAGLGSGSDGKLPPRLLDKSSSCMGGGEGGEKKINTSTREDGGGGSVDQIAIASGDKRMGANRTAAGRGKTRVPKAPPLGRRVRQRGTVIAAEDDEDG